MGSLNRKVKGFILLFALRHSSLNTAQIVMKTCFLSVLNVCVGDLAMPALDFKDL